MKYVSDNSGRFRQRPHYLPAELDLECEATITAFMREVCGEFALPIPTDVLTKLIERDAQYLDLYADLSKEEGTNVEGVTDFVAGAKPIVRIASALSEGANRSHRLRTTLTHEYGHVKFHDYLYQASEPTGSLFADAFEKKPAKCKRDTMLDAPTADWMEWQAGYACGSMLMPLTSVKKLISEFRQNHNLVGPIPENRREGMILLATVADAFDVSQEAARIRLLKLGCLGSDKTQASLF